MKTSYPENWPQFFTATIHEWKHLLKNDLYKDLIIDGLRYAVMQKRIKLFAFVIMSNHIHIIWQQLLPFSKTEVQLGFMKYTAQKIKFHLQINNQTLLAEFKVQEKDSALVRGTRNKLSIAIKYLIQVI